MAKMPTIIAAFARLRSGQTGRAAEDLGFAANFLYAQRTRGYGA